MGRFFGISGWVVAFSVVAVMALAQTDLRQIQQDAEQALVAGDPDGAAQSAQDLLSRVPDSFAGLMLLALAQSDLGETTQAIATAKRAYRAAPDDETRLQAARLVASAHYRLGHYARSEIWLRRASDHARSDAETVAVAREYQLAALANPVSIQTTLSIAPSDNINNASADGILTFEGIGLQLQLPEDQRALSGIGYSGSVRLAYRLAQDERQVTIAGLFLSGDTYTLSRDARARLAASPIPRVQGLNGHDFRSFVSELNLTHRRNGLTPYGLTSATIAAGCYWEGSAHLVNYQDVIVRQTIPQGPDRSVTLEGSVRWQQAVSSAVVDAVVFDFSGAYDIRLPAQDQLQLSIAVRHRDGGFENIYDEYRGGIAYAFARPVLTARLRSALDIGYRSYDAFPTTLDGRRDRFVTLQTTAVLAGITYFGFSPDVTVKATRTASTASEFTTAAVELRIGVQSNF